MAGMARRLLGVEIVPQAVETPGRTPGSTELKTRNSSAGTRVRQPDAGGAATIISTNLTLKELESRYSERFASRIAGYYGKLEFLGNDVRVQKRLQKSRKHP